jgi:hypothetical protein
LLSTVVIRHVLRRDAWHHSRTLCGARLPPKTIVTVDGERQFISQQVDFEQREYHIEHRTAFSVAIVFRYGRATSIMLSDYHS